MTAVTTSDWTLHAGGARRGGPRGWQPVRRAAAERFGLPGFPTSGTRSGGSRRSRRSAAACLAGPRRPSRRARGRELAPFLFGHPEWPHAGLRERALYSPSTRSIGSLPAGVTVANLAEALGPTCRCFEQHLGSACAGGRDARSPRSTPRRSATARLVHVPAGHDLSSPVHLLFVTTAEAAGAAIHPRNLIVVEREARASVIESYVTLADGERYLTNRGHRGRRRPRAHGSSTPGSSGRASARTTSVSPTSHQAARQPLPLLHPRDGCGASPGTTCTPGSTRERRDACSTDSISPRRAAGRQPHRHLSRPAQLPELGGLQGHARRPVPRRCSTARSSSSPRPRRPTPSRPIGTCSGRPAKVDTKPQLEIFADDVKCTHGATVGRLDDVGLFYVRSRGIPAKAAERLLTYAFAAEVVDEVALEPVRLELDRLVLERLGASAEGGRSAASGGTRRARPAGAAGLFGLSGPRAASGRGDPPRFPDPRDHGARAPPRLSRQRGDQPEAPGGHRRDRPVLHDRQCQHSSWRLRAQRGGHGRVRSGPRAAWRASWAPRARRRSSSRAAPPRASTWWRRAGGGRPSAQGTRFSSPRWSTTRIWCPGSCSPSRRVRCCAPRRSPSRASWIWRRGTGC